SEEHTSELQSLTNLVCRLLLEKKKHLALANEVIESSDESSSHHSASWGELQSAHQASANSNYDSCTLKEFLSQHSASIRLIRLSSLWLRLLRYFIGSSSSLSLHSLACLAPNLRSSRTLPLLNCPTRETLPTYTFLFS